MDTRIEKDFIGELEIPKDALFGIHALRAKENFPGSAPFSLAWYKAMGMVKLAYFESVKAFSDALKKEYPTRKWAFKVPSEKTIIALKSAATEIIEGNHYDQFIVPAIQGGAGTSINMNINEILANRALQLSNHELADYSKIDPIEDSNIFQSTNDTVPSALRVAAMLELDKLEHSVNLLRTEFEKKENEYRNFLRIGYTQFQEAVPGSYGRLFSSYCDALSRDWWRISKGKERIKVINLGGSAIGTGLTVPRFIIMQVNDNLRNITKLPLSRGENLSDSTSNQDDIVELHGLLKTLAVNLEKIAGDLRIMSSDVSGIQGFALPARQAGSSIMPGKVNPVIPEFVISSSHQIYANDAIITSLAAQGSLDLNPYLPQMGKALLNSIELLQNSSTSLAINCVSKIHIEAKETEKQVLKSPSVSTALIPIIGYKKATEFALYMKENSCTIIEANTFLKLINEDRLLEIIKPENLLKMGFSVKDLDD